MKINIVNNKQRRANKIRSKVSGYAKTPRVSVFRSNKYIYAQVIDDTKSHTLAAVGKVEKEKGMSKVDVAKKTGELLGVKLNELKIKSVVFDRAGFRYHGRVKALAEGIRSAGIKF